MVCTFEVRDMGVVFVSEAHSIFTLLNLLEYSVSPTTIMHFSELKSD